MPAILGSLVRTEYPWMITDLLEPSDYIPEPNMVTDYDMTCGEVRIVGVIDVRIRRLPVHPDIRYIVALEDLLNCDEDIVHVTIQVALKNFPYHLAKFLHDREDILHHCFCIPLFHQWNWTDMYAPRNADGSIGKPQYPYPPCTFHPNYVDLVDDDDDDDVE